VPNDFISKLLTFLIKRSSLSILVIFTLYRKPFVRIMCRNEVQILQWQSEVIICTKDFQPFSRVSYVPGSTRKPAFLQRKPMGSRIF
jgi:hypothetical protein